MNIEIYQRETYIEVFQWKHRNHADIFHFELGTQFQFNGSNEFIAKKNGEIIKPFKSEYDQ
jgi:hypothetical protein